MRRRITRLGSAMALALLILAAMAHGAEEKVPLDKVPKPLLKAVKARFEGAAVSGAGKEMEDGKLVYELTIKHKGRNIDVTLTPEGDILSIEKEIAARELPQGVAKTLEDKYPKAMYKIVEEIIKVEKKQEKLAYYEVLLVTAAKKSLEVQITAGGKIVNEEAKNSEKDEGK